MWELNPELKFFSSISIFILYVKIWNKKVPIVFNFREKWLCTPPSNPLRDALESRQYFHGKVQGRLSV